MSKHLGSNFDDFLEEEGLLAEVQAEAVKRVVVWQLNKFMKENGLSKSALAKALGTSRTGVDRLLDETNLSVTLSTIVSVAQLTGKKLKLSFI